MRGTDETTGVLVSDVDLEERIPARRPLRKVRAIVIDALASMEADSDDTLAASPPAASSSGSTA